MAVPVIRVIVIRKLLDLYVELANPGLSATPALAANMEAAAAQVLLAIQDEVTLTPS